MYEGYWGLKEKPFCNTPDPLFLYFAPKHKEAFSKLIYAAQEKMGAGVLTGIFGCGKTLLAQALLNDLHSLGGYQVALITHTQFSRLEFLRTLASSLGAVNLPDTKADLLSDFLVESIRDILTQNMKDGRHTVVIIDEAHLIKDMEVFEEMRLLLNFQANKRFLLTLLVIGQPELIKTINHNRQFLQRVSFFSHLIGLEREEVTKYIFHRLTVAGAKGPIFTEGAIEMIYRKSGGIPRRINQICDIALLLGAQQKSKSINEADILSSLEYSGIPALEGGMLQEETTVNLNEEVTASLGGLDKPQEQPRLLKDKTDEALAMEQMRDIDLDEPESLCLYKTCIMWLESTFNRLRSNNEAFDIGMFTSLSGQLVNRLKENPNSLWALTSKAYPQDYHYLYPHSLNVAILSILLAIELDYDENRLSKLATAALLHDIGMGKVPREILDKHEKCSEDEYEIIRQHPAWGAEFFSKKTGGELNDIIARVISEHHERLNGSGYPDKKLANEISEFSKVIGLTDVYESLMHARSYRHRLDPYKALVEIIDLDEKGFFDNSLVKTLIGKFSFYPVGCWTRLNTGEIARVVAINKNALVSPVVRVELDAQTQPLFQPKIIDLARRSKFSIQESIEDPRENPETNPKETALWRSSKAFYDELLSKTAQIFTKVE
ncbi:MAG: HD domain-containing phosphohydrolase [Candidatus Omnitrophota bacterium]